MGAIIDTRGFGPSRVIQLTLGNLASFGFLKYKKNERHRIGEQGTGFCCQLRATE